MAYTPEPTHPLDPATTPAQLNREFWALFNNDAALKDYIVGAMPHKAFNIILDGAGGSGGTDPNPVDPVIRGLGTGLSYNIDPAYGGGDGVIRTGVGTYEFQLLNAQISGINILDATFPTFDFYVDFPANAVTRAGPTRTSFDSAFRFGNIDPVTGIFQVVTEHIYATGGGGLSRETTDMQLNDVFYAFGVLSIRGQSGNYPDTP